MGHEARAKATQDKNDKRGGPKHRRASVAFLHDTFTQVMLDGVEIKAHAGNVANDAGIDAGGSTLVLWLTKVSVEKCVDDTCFVSV